jgi:hypothetical protein
MDNMNALETLAALAGGQGTERPEKCSVRCGVYYLERRISLLINLPVKSLDQLTLGARRREIGQTAGAANRRPHGA